MGRPPPQIFLGDRLPVPRVSAHVYRLSFYSPILEQFERYVTQTLCSDGRAEATEEVPASDVAWTPSIGPKRAANARR